MRDTDGVQRAIYPTLVQTIIYRTSGLEIVNGKCVGPVCNHSTCDPSMMPSLACPIFACMCYWPLGIGVLFYYLRARKLIQGNCFF